MVGLGVLRLVRLGITRIRVYCNGRARVGIVVKRLLRD